MKTTLKITPLIPLAGEQVIKDILTSYYKYATLTDGLSGCLNEDGVSSALVFDCIGVIQNLSGLYDSPEKEQMGETIIFGGPEIYLPSAIGLIDGAKVANKDTDFKLMAEFAYAGIQSYAEHAKAQGTLKDGRVKMSDIEEVCRMYLNFQYVLNAAESVGLHTSMNRGAITDLTVIFKTVSAMLGYSWSEIQESFRGEGGFFSAEDEICDTFMSVADEHTPYDKARKTEKKVIANIRRVMDKITTLKGGQSE